MRCSVGILFAPAILHRLIHFVFVGQVERDRTVDLLQAQSWVVRLDGFRIFAMRYSETRSIGTRLPIR
jgi:hypothetical protein